MFRFDTKEGDMQNSRQGQYPIPPSDADEARRLSLQDELLNDLFPLFFTGYMHPKRVLDVACGTGGWLRRVAHAYPNAECVGLDKSALLLDYARALASTEHVNITYKQGDMFDIAKSSGKVKAFDYIQMRCACWFLGSRVQEIFADCAHLLKPGATFCVIDFKQPPHSNSDALQRWNGYFMEALQRRGTSYAQVDQFAKIFGALGLVNIQQKPYVLDLSVGIEGREGFLSDLRSVFEVFKPVLFEVLDEEAFESIKAQVFSDFEAPGFEMFIDALMISGQKA
jgi:ubiquinone/menaquinone biosynthesis C-methylase UbiE